jgi:Secretion system C-terminal sorting domain
MKGATINTTAASSSFGDTSSLNNAGNYEVGTICYVKSDSVFFDYFFLNNYTVADKVQLVRIPEYVSATVTDTLRAAPWNNTTGTGGVLAIYVDQDLVLNAPVSGDSSGYRGGIFKLSNGTCSNTPGATQYAYNASLLSPQNGGYKGEGVVDIPIAISGGRGAPANGGGGGNNHNNGGAGGANLTAGGDGGANSSSTGCMLALPGKGGKALSSYGGTKIFMGGGGGAGHNNNGFAPTNGGGHGGGIVFIRAANLIGNGQKISANGQVGGPGASDGASGAGAGGTIILNVANYIGTTAIAANGGQGGLEDDGGNINKCYGSGGGGSGGAIYFSGSVPGAPVTITVNAGNFGPEINHDVSCNAAIPSSPGSAGQTFSNYTYSSSMVLANNYCSALLPVELSSFTALYVNGHATLNWKTLQPEMVDHFIIEKRTDVNDWTNLYVQPANDAVQAYQYNDPLTTPGEDYYRIKVIKKNNVIAYSVIRKVIVPGKNETITIYPNPASKKIFITGINSSAALKLFDLSGKLLWQKRIVTNQSFTEVELPSLPAGVYVMRVDDVIRKIILR